MLRRGLLVTGTVTMYYASAHPPRLAYKTDMAVNALLVYDGGKGDVRTRTTARVSPLASWL